MSKVAMTNKEKILLEKIANLELDKRNTKLKMVRLQKEITERETELIEIMLEIDKTAEDLRVFRATTPIQPKTLHELEIEKFRADNPEVVAFAKERDNKIGKE